MLANAEKSPTLRLNRGRIAVPCLSVKKTRFSWLYLKCNENNYELLFLLYLINVIQHYKSFISIFK